MRSAADLPSTDRPAFEAMCRDWRDRSIAAFLDSYRANIEGVASWPEKPKEVAGLLELMLLEKVLYEIGYEQANRPVWLPIPVQGLIDLLDRKDGRVSDGLGQ
jgi:maltose alpha-D-glucosyltransferase / alpha-amylase